MVKIRYQTSSIQVFFILRNSLLLAHKKPPNAYFVQPWYVVAELWNIVAVLSFV